jgi:quercetin dioxygenase-like cupin family protein
MKRSTLTFLALAIIGLNGLFSQNSYHSAAKALQPDKPFDNVLVTRLYGDAHASGFVIWVKERVPLHKHAGHSETVFIIEGKGEMQLGDQRLTVRKGDILFIPAGTPHAVDVRGGVLKVMSIQAPEFDGTDRILLEK